jgi:hypothetical protein
MLNLVIKFVVFDRRTARNDLIKTSARLLLLLLLINNEKQ